MMTREDKFEEFLKETKNFACLGCGEVGLYEYIVTDEATGAMKCPKCGLATNLKQAMHSWVQTKNVA